MSSLLSRFVLLVAFVVFSSVWVVPGAAVAQEWPTRPVTLVVKYSAGGGTDLLLRTLAKAMENELGQPIKVTNMTGGVGSIAAQYVYDQPADGYTWLGFGNFLKHFRAMGLVDLAAWRDFDTFLVGNSLASWSVTSDSPIGSFEEFVEMARANPGKLKVATDGKGGLWHEVMSLLGVMLDFKVNLITYDGGAPATLAALQNEVDVVASGLHEHIEFIKAGKLRNLAQFSDQDIEVPDVGTLRSITNIVPETKEMAPFGSMYGIGLKRGTPKPALMKVKAAIEAALTVRRNPALQVSVFAEQRPEHLRTHSIGLYEGGGSWRVGVGQVGLDEDAAIGFEPLHRRRRPLIDGILLPQRLSTSNEHFGTGELDSPAAGWIVNPDRASVGARGGQQVSQHLFRLAGHLLIR